MLDIKVTPLGAGQDVGRSCILLTIGGKNIMLDCGMHMGYNDERRFPDFTFITQEGGLTEHLDCVIISHFHLDHCGALPYMTEMVGYNGPIYMTIPTKAICPILLEDYRKITVEKKGESNFFTSAMVKDCMKKVVGVNLHQTVQVDDELEIKAYYAGHVLGAAMFQIKVGSQSVVYTGDYNTTPDRHLGSAWIDKCRPDLLITESTYATTIRDSKRCRERDFLTKVHDCVDRGGKVLIPVFALGRAQELCILLESYWERMNLKVPIYFAVGLTERATTFYKMFITWTNQKIRKTFVHRNMFDFKHIKAFDRAYIDNPGPMVVFATPGMLHSGLSLQLFKKWAPNDNNMLIMPGYCTSGTVGHKVVNGAKKIEFENRQTVEVKMSVQYMSFSAHADAKGIMQLIRHCEPANVMLVHGEAAKMEFLKKKICQEIEKLKLQDIGWWNDTLQIKRKRVRKSRRKMQREKDNEKREKLLIRYKKKHAEYKEDIKKAKEEAWRKYTESATDPLGTSCYMPANGETVTISTKITIPIDASINLLKRQAAEEAGGDNKQQKILHGALMVYNNTLRLVEPEVAMAEVGVTPHQIRFTCTVQIEDPSGSPTSRIADCIYHRIKEDLKSQNVQLAADGSITVASALIKVDCVEDDMKNVCVSWAYQDEELGSHLLEIVKNCALDIK